MNVYSINSSRKISSLILISQINHAAIEPAAQLPSNRRGLDLTQTSKEVLPVIEAVPYRLLVQGLADAACHVAGSLQTGIR